MSKKYVNGELVSLSEDEETRSGLAGIAGSSRELFDIVNEAYAGFHHELKSPLIKLEDNHYFLELFHGASLELFAN